MHAGSAASDPRFSATRGKNGEKLSRRRAQLASTQIFELPRATPNSNVINVTTANGVIILHDTHVRGV